MWPTIAANPAAPARRRRSLKRSASTTLAAPLRDVEQRHQDAGAYARRAQHVGRAEVAAADAAQIGAPQRRASSSANGTDPIEIGGNRRRRGHTTVRLARAQRTYTSASDRTDDLSDAGATFAQTGGRAVKRRNRSREPPSRQCARVSRDCNARAPCSRSAVQPVCSDRARTPIYRRATAPSAGGDIADARGAIAADTPSPSSASTAQARGIVALNKTTSGRRVGSDLRQDTERSTCRAPRAMRQLHGERPRPHRDAARLVGRDTMPHAPRRPARPR